MFMVGVILAAGDGTRLKMSTGQDICKSLRKINDKHLIEYALNNLIALGTTDAYVVIGKQGDLIKDAIGEKYESLNVHYVRQAHQNGLVNAFVEALNVIDDNETVILQLADEIFVDLKTEAIKNALISNNSNFYCGVTYEENEEKIKNNFSVEADDESRLVKCIEKPKVVTDNIKGTGFSIFNGKSQKIIKETYATNPEKLYDLCDCFNYLTTLGYGGSILFIAEREFNINTHSDLTEAEIFFK